MSEEFSWEGREGVVTRVEDASPALPGGVCICQGLSCIPWMDGYEMDGTKDVVCV